MNTPRFYCSEPLIAHSTLTLPAEVVHHLRVLRLKVGEPFTLFDGLGQEFLTHLKADLGATSSTKPLYAQLEAATVVDRELPGKITLIQGLAVSDKLDWVIEKAVELGVYRVIPVAAQRSVLRLDDARALKKHQHWQRIVQSASEQCGRNVLMHVDVPCRLDTALKKIKGDGLLTIPLWVAHPEGAVKLTTCLEQAQKPLSDIHLAVGPEGGWSESELALFLQQTHAQTISLGQRVLRTETAGMATVSMITGYLNW